MIGKLLSTAGLAVLCWTCAPVGSGTPVAEPADPAALTYRSRWLESGKVTLTKGAYRAPAAPGSSAEFVVRLSDWRAFGTLDGREAGVVILVTQAGGTGSFYDLALLTRATSGWVNSDVVPLGDRVAIQELAIRDNQVVVTMTVQGPRDPLCCPTLAVERRFAMREGKLVATGESPVALPAAGLVGPVWRWVQSQYSNDTRAVPPRPAHYTVQFGADGTVNVSADCNRKGGRYSGRERQLAIEITHSTMAACPEDSLEDRFVRDLVGATGWFLRDGDLYIDLRYDTGTMRFEQ